MVFEIALRVRQTYQSNYSQSADTETFESWVRCGQYMTIAVSLASILAITTEDLVNMKDFKSEDFNH